MQNEVEVIEKKEKKPLGKKGIVLRILIVVLALLVLVGAFFGITRGRFYKEDGVYMNSFITIKDVYLEDHVLHYTVVNKTRFTVHEQLRESYTTTLAMQQDGEWVSIIPPVGTIIKGQNIIGWNRNEVLCGAFTSEEMTYPVNIELEPGQYRLHRKYHLCSFGGDRVTSVHIFATFEIPAAS